MLSPFHVCRQEIQGFALGFLSQKKQEQAENEACKEVQGFAKAYLRKKHSSRGADAEQ